MAPTGFGEHLRTWRRVRGLSQLDLATAAEVSQRHISFLETARSRPSREMVIHLGHALDVPPREQNLLLLAAGYAPEFGETALDALDHISAMLDAMLQASLPNMAIVVDRRWNVVRANPSATTLLSKLFPQPPSWVQPHLNVMRLNFHPDGMRNHMIDWESTATALLRRLERDAAIHPGDRDLQDLVEEVRGYPSVDSLPRHVRAPAASDLVVPATYVVDGEEISLFTTIAIIGDAHDLTLAELRIETFWPLDHLSGERWSRLVGRSAEITET
jgi:transcriptional regulator with XRE-family HTH domain